MAGLIFGGVGDLHDLRHGVSLLHGPRCDRADAAEVLEIPIFGTVCLLSSSGFIMLAERAIEHGRWRRFSCGGRLRFLLGAIFLVIRAWSGTS